MWAGRVRLEPVVAVAIALACGVRPVGALVVAPPLTNQNTAAPGDDPGWDNVADIGVYVGHRWMLTANHVGPGNPTFAGVGTFFFQPGTAIRIQNPSGPDPYADLVMYQLTTNPPLPALAIASRTPDVDDEVTLIGDGLGVGPTATEKNWNRIGTDPNYTYRMVPTGGAFHGYVSDSVAKLWGTNLVEDDERFFHEGDVGNHTYPADSGNGDTVSFITEFDKEGLTLGHATEHEAQAQGGDSGSAAFWKEDGQWVLAGITHAVEIEPNQPFGTGSALYTNLTFMADLSFYRSQILATIPEASGAALVPLAGVLMLVAGRVLRGTCRISFFVRGTP